MKSKLPAEERWPVFLAAKVPESRNPELLRKLYYAAGASYIAGSVVGGCMGGLRALATTRAGPNVMMYMVMDAGALLGTRAGLASMSFMLAKHGLVYLLSKTKSAGEATSPPSRPST